MQKLTKREHAMRAENLRRFQKYTLQFLAFEKDVHEGAKGTFMYWFEAIGYDKITLYPKGDKVHVERSGVWHNGIDQFLNKYILKTKI